MRANKYPYTQVSGKRQRLRFIRITTENINCLEVLKTNSQEKE